ncbi:MAG: S1 RNA-binding domain-containing protein [Chloroflexi bacterium]|nr:S1 RNA-binding domain-containing protein [Chloroflexota bacterium]
MDEQETPVEKNKEEETSSDSLSMKALLETGELTLDLPRKGDIRKGVIASITEEEILVSIGAKSEGVIPPRELEHIPEEERAKFKVGDEISVYILSLDSRQGGVLLSYGRALEEDDWTNAEELMKNNEVFEGIIESFNKGGLIVQMGRLRAFVPGSQVSNARRMAYKGDTPEQRWGKMVGEPLVARVIEVDRQRRRLILSERSASTESRDSLKERLLEELHEGDMRTGRVTSLAEFGAFVNINGADGLVHLSEISWERISDPSEVLEVGQEVEVKVISIDRERKRIGLSLRQLQDDPWIEKVSRYQVGQLVEGNITRLAKFGAFARIDDDMEGLIHVSELSDERVEHPKEVIKEGDQATLRIIKIDKKRRRIGLSLRKVDSGAFRDVDWEMTLAEIDEYDEAADDSEPEPELIEEVSDDLTAGDNDDADDEGGEEETEAETTPDESEEPTEAPEDETSAEENEEESGEEE